MAMDRPGLGVIEDGVIASRDGRIAFVGAAADLPAGADAVETIALDGRWVTPGLVDCHTHIVYADNRAAEWEMRLDGAAYEAIARAGGGIVSSVRSVRATSEDALVTQALGRVDRLIAEGVTTLESKSGYGLDLAQEMKLLRAGRTIAEKRRLRALTSFLGAHALPPEAEGDRDAYMDLVCTTMLPAVAEAGLADAVDAFCESIAFSPDQVARLFTAAQALGLPVKLHADQLTNGGGAALAARFGALSADHLEYTDDAGAAAMAAAGTVAVLLPGAYYVLREKKAPDVAAFRRHGVPIAVSTDCNPGTSPLTSLLLTMHMAATLFGLTVHEALLGTTREAARALGKFDDIGSLETGKACDLAIWSVGHPAEIFHNLGSNPLHSRVFAGEPG
ncbi:imidazolonepropionase [Acidisoma silvae]|uniref:Imidazolonepropionase n=1 Tax=Acidisoma silvae TaxID=2802396 RepID=A0A963YNM7_9PROT|nr:imidazolonepropionase [Acidisoma silvae]MCB8874165.1 imidazolonepropionase [Acidisoma silvae]